MAIFDLDDDESAPTTPALAGPTTSSSAPAGRAVTAGSSGANPTPGSAPGPNTTPGSGNNFVSAAQFQQENPGAGGGQAQGEMAAQLAGLKAAGAQAQGAVNQANTNVEQNYQNTENQAYNAWQANIPNEFVQRHNFWGKTLTPSYIGQAFNANTSPGTEVTPTLDAYTPPTGVTAGAEALKNEVQNPGMVGNPAQTTQGQSLNNFLDLSAGEAEQQAPGAQTTATQLEAGTPAPTINQYTAANGGRPTGQDYQNAKDPNNGFWGMGIANGLSNVNWAEVAATTAAAAAAYYAFEGGEVPGEAPMPGDHEENDTVPLKVKPGSVVIPRSVAMTEDAPEKAVKFVRATHLRNAIKGKR